MVEPLAVVGLISNIAQFVEYGAKIVSETIDVYKDQGGTTSELEEMETVLRNVTHGYEKLERGQNHIQQHQPRGLQDPTIGKTGTLEVNSDLTLITLCKPIIEELSVLLQQLKPRIGKETKLEALRVAMRRIRKREDLRSLESRLDRILKQISHHNTAILRKQQSQILEMLNNFIPKFDKIPIHDLGALGESPIMFTENSVRAKIDTLRALKQQVIKDQMRADTDDAISAVSSAFDRLNFTEHTSSEGISTDIHSIANNLQLIKSLWYPECKSRRMTIKDAHDQTLKWIFEEKDVNALHNWLKHGSGIFWIRGKAGSGKSTLMKWLYDNPETKAALKEWCGSKSLVIASHYFWISGYRVQRSLDGLYRGILCQILAQDASLTTCLPSLQYRLAQSNDMLEFDTSKVLCDWSRKELETVLEEIAAYYSDPERSDPAQNGTRVCLFIDGLDEYDSKHEEGDIIRILKKLSSYSGVKLCVSSRPWVVFVKAFDYLSQSKNTITIEQLTSADMKRYITSQLEDCEEFKQLAQNDKTAYQIIDKVARKAQGVWLWVYLVMRMLREDLCHDESLERLNQTVDEVPAEMNDFLKSLHQRIDKRHTTEAARILLVACISDEPITAFGLQFILDNQTEEKYMKAALDFQNSEPRKPIDLIALRNRLSNRCKDLVDLKLDNHLTGREVDSVLYMHTLEFLHRAVRDYLVDYYVPVLEKDAKVGIEFDPQTCLLSMTLEMAKERAIFADSVIRNNGQRPARDARVLNSDYGLLNRVLRMTMLLDRLYMGKLRFACISFGHHESSGTYPTGMLQSIAGHQLPNGEIRLYKDILNYFALVEMAYRYTVLILVLHERGALSGLLDDSEAIIRFAVVINLQLYFQNAISSNFGLIQNSALLDFSLSVLLDRYSLNEPGFRTFSFSFATAVDQDLDPTDEPLVHVLTYISNRFESECEDSTRGENWMAVYSDADMIMPQYDLERISLLLNCGLSPNAEMLRIPPEFECSHFHNSSKAYDSGSNMSTTRTRVVDKFKVSTPWHFFLMNLYKKARNLRIRWDFRKPENSTVKHLSKSDQDSLSIYPAHMNPFHSRASGKVFVRQKELSIAIELLIKHGADLVTPIELTEWSTESLKSLSYEEFYTFYKSTRSHRSYQGSEEIKVLRKKVYFTPAELIEGLLGPSETAILLSKAPKSSYTIASTTTTSEQQFIATKSTLLDQNYQQEAIQIQSSITPYNPPVRSGIGSGNCAGGAYSPPVPPHQDIRPVSYNGGFETDSKQAHFPRRSSSNSGYQSSSSHMETENLRLYDTIPTIKEGCEMETVQHLYRSHQNTIINSDFDRNFETPSSRPIPSFSKSPSSFPRPGNLAVGPGPDRGGSKSPQRYMPYSRPPGRQREDGKE